MAPVTAKAPKEAKSKKTALATKKPRAYPTYYEMVNEAIIALKERTGSSQIAIAKFIDEKQKVNLPINFKKLLLVQLKKFVANGKLVKVKNSFKLPSKLVAVKEPKSRSTSVATKKPKSSTTTAVAKKAKSAPAKEAAAKKPKSTSASAAAKKSKASSTTAPAGTKRKASDANVVSKKPKAEGKKAVATKAKKPKSIKSPAKKVATKKGKN